MTISSDDHSRYRTPRIAQLGGFAERTGLGFGDQAERWTPFADRWA